MRTHSALQQVGLLRVVCKPASGIGADQARFSAPAPDLTDRGPDQLVRHSPAPERTIHKRMVENRHAVLFRKGDLCDQRSVLHGKDAAGFFSRSFRKVFRSHLQMDHIFSGASTPMSFSPFFSTMRVSSASFSRAACTAGSSPLMRQAV